LVTFSTVELKKKNFSNQISNFLKIPVFKILLELFRFQLLF